MLGSHWRKKPVQVEVDLLTKVALQNVYCLQSNKTNILRYIILLWEGML